MYEDLPMCNHMPEFNDSKFNNLTFRFDIFQIQ